MTVSTTSVTMPDVQSRVDTRQIAIQKVGVRGVRYPLQGQIGAQPQPTVADWELAVALPVEVKGTHMSRSIALLEVCGAQDVGLQGFFLVADVVLGLGYVSHRVEEIVVTIV